MDLHFQQAEDKKQLLLMIDGGTTDVVDQSTTNTIGVFSIRAISRQQYLPCTIVWRRMQIAFKAYIN